MRTQEEHTVDCEDPDCSECCMHEESECGICNDCGAEVDWVSRLFQEND